MLTIATATGNAGEHPPTTPLTCGDSGNLRPDGGWGRRGVAKPAMVMVGDGGRAADGSLRWAGAADAH